MDKLRSMPDKEKFQRVFGLVRQYQKQVMPFVEERLGYAAMHELRSVWQAAITPIHRDHPDHENYENDYSNWLWMAQCSHDFLSDLLDHEAVLDYKRLLLRCYNRQIYNPDLVFYRMVRNHTALSKGYLYEMQWMTPVELTNSDKLKVQCVVHECKILQTPGSERVCRVDCMNVGTALARKIYNLRRETSLNNHGCTITLTPIES